jgi:DNA primase
VSRYAPDSRDRVYDAVDMVSLVGSRVELRRAGVDSYFGNCPFHDERTGSFHVTPDKKVYHCFGCQASGDPFTFVQETEGVDFKGALESLATRFGVALETVDEDPQYAERRRRQDRLYELLARTATYYGRYLWEAAEAGEARDYLAGRGLAEETLRAFRVGYAPNAWDRILTGSRRAGYTEEELLAVGLIRRSERSRAGAFDFFREQVMFPAADARGRVHGFGARRMREEQRLPKYVNTSDGDLYHKREVLFGIDKARGDAAKAGRMILVEGYTDVLALHQAGFRNVVGIMGTSFTKEQLEELQKTVTVLELCLDADSAGQQAVVRAERMANERGVEVRVVVLPPGLDPADLALSQGAEALRERLNASVLFVSFNVDRLLAAADTSSTEGRDRVLPDLAEALKWQKPSLVRDQMLQKISGTLGLSESQFAGLLADAEQRSKMGAAPQAQIPNGAPPATTPGSRSERFFLALCIAVPGAGTRALAGPEVDQLLPTEVMRRAARHLRERTATPLAELPPDDEAFARVVSGLVELAGRVPEPSPDRLEHTRLLLDLERLERAILRARAAGEGTNELARERELVRDAYQQVVSRLEETM